LKGRLSSNCGKSEKAVGRNCMCFKFGTRLPHSTILTSRSNLSKITAAVCIRSLRGPLIANEPLKTQQRV